MQYVWPVSTRNTYNITAVIDEVMRRICDVIDTRGCGNEYRGTGQEWWQQQGGISGICHQSAIEMGWKGSKMCYSAWCPGAQMTVGMLLLRLHTTSTRTGCKCTAWTLLQTWKKESHFIDIWIYRYLHAYIWESTEQFSFFHFEGFLGHKIFSAPLCRKSLEFKNKTLKHYAKNTC